MVRSHLQPRTTRIYANNSVYSPAGLLMFRCSDKKLAWYVRRRLAEPIPSPSREDGSIDVSGQAVRLLFQPRGIGRNRPGDAWYLEHQVDRCVACGRTGLYQDSKLDVEREEEGMEECPKEEAREASTSADMTCTVQFNAASPRRLVTTQQSQSQAVQGQVDEDQLGVEEDEGEEDRIGLTLHHVVPYQYRREMPESFKSHGSHDVLALCTVCHDRYEVAADIEKNILVQRYDAPLSGRGWLKVPEHARVWNAAAALLRYKRDIPAQRIAQLEDIIMAFYGLQSKSDVTEAVLTQCLELKAMDKGPDFQEHGALVISAMQREEGEAGFARFVKFWRRHFLETMQPRYLSPHWSVDDPVNLVAGEYNPYRPEMDGQ